MEVRIKQETFSGKKCYTAEIVKEPLCVGQGDTVQEAYDEAIGNYEALKNFEATKNFEVKREPQHEFKVGDIVKILINPLIEGSCNFKLGDIVYIQGILNDNYYCLVKTNGEVISYGFERDELEYIRKSDEPPRWAFTEPEPRWSFTEDEKTILRNLPEEYKWIARDEDDILCCFKSRYKPTKDEFFGIWNCANAMELRPFSHIFECIKWSDSEPCEFRKFL